MLQSASQGKLFLKLNFSLLFQLQKAALKNMNTNIKDLSKGLLAAAFGLAFVLTGSAFKEGKNAKRTMYTFYYDGPNYTAAEVTNESNWKYDSNDNTCSGIDEQACTIRVSAGFVDNPASAPSLKPSLNLTAAASSSSINYVSGSSDSALQISNKAHN